MDKNSKYYIYTPACKKNNIIVNLECGSIDQPYIALTIDEINHIDGIYRHIKNKDLLEQEEKNLAALRKFLKLK